MKVISVQTKTLNHFTVILAPVLVSSQYPLLVSVSVQCSSPARPSMPAGWGNSQKPYLPPQQSPSYEY